MFCSVTISCPFSAHFVYSQFARHNPDCEMPLLSNRMHSSFILNFCYSACPLVPLETRSLFFSNNLILLVVPIVYLTLPITKVLYNGYDIVVEYI
jgi:hypothetical protein